MTKIRVQKSGFTLVEVMVSVIMLTIVSVGAGGALVYARRAMENGNQKMIAVHLIETEIVKCMMIGAENLEVTSTTPPSPSTPPGPTTPELNNGWIQRIVDEPDPGNSNWKSVVVKAGWDDIGRPSRVCTNAGTTQCDNFREAMMFLSQGG